MIDLHNGNYKTFMIETEELTNKNRKIIDVILMFILLKMIDRFDVILNIQVKLFTALEKANYKSYIEPQNLLHSLSF